MSEDLSLKKCKPCEGGTKPMNPVMVQGFLADLPGWELSGPSGPGQGIAKTYSFKNYHQTMAFVNATAFISHQEDHHPDLTVFYKTCRVFYVTHAIGGLSENDFICAAKVEKLLKV